MQVHDGEYPHAIRFIKIHHRIGKIAGQISTGGRVILAEARGRSSYFQNQVFDFVVEASAKFGIYCRVIFRSDGVFGIGFGMEDMGFHAGGRAGGREESAANNLADFGGCLFAGDAFDFVVPDVGDALMHDG